MKWCRHISRDTSITLYIIVLFRGNARGIEATLVVLSFGTKFGAGKGGNVGPCGNPSSPVYGHEFELGNVVERKSRKYVSL